MALPVSPSDDVADGNLVFLAKYIECTRNGCTVAPSVLEHIRCELDVYLIVRFPTVPIYLSDLLLCRALVPLRLASVVAGFGNDGFVKVGAYDQIVSVVSVLDADVFVHK